MILTCLANQLVYKISNEEILMKYLVLPAQVLVGQLFTH